MFETHQSTNSPVRSVIKEFKTLPLNIQQSTNDYDQSAQSKSSHVVRRTKDTNLVRRKLYFRKLIIRIKCSTFYTYTNEPLHKKRMWNKQNSVYK